MRSLVREPVIIEFRVHNGNRELFWILRLQGADRRKSIDAVILDGDIGPQHLWGQPEVTLCRIYRPDDCRYSVRKRQLREDADIHISESCDVMVRATAVMSIFIFITSSVTEPRFGSRYSPRSREYLARQQAQS